MARSKKKKQTDEEWVDNFLKDVSDEKVKIIDKEENNIKLLNQILEKITADDLITEITAMEAQIKELDKKIKIYKSIYSQCE